MNCTNCGRELRRMCIFCSMRQGFSRMLGCANRRQCGCNGARHGMAWIENNPIFTNPLSFSAPPFRFPPAEFMPQPGPKEFRFPNLQTSPHFPAFPQFPGFKSAKPASPVSISPTRTEWNHTPIVLTLPKRHIGDID